MPISAPAARGQLQRHIPEIVDIEAQLDARYLGAPMAPHRPRDMDDVIRLIQDPRPAARLLGRAP